MADDIDDVGSGIPLVLLHAFPLSWEMWWPQRDALASVCRVIAPDLPGFGNAPLLDGPPTVEGMADAVARKLDALGVAGPVVLGGLSMGGYVAFAFARKYPDRLAGLILADTRAEPDDDAAKANRDKMIGFAATNPASAVIEQMLPKLLGATTHARRPELVDQVRRIGSAQRPAGIIAALQVLRNRPDSRPTLKAIHLPTLVIVGGEDALTPPSAAEGMAKGIAGARLVILGEAGHLSNLERPEAFGDAVRAFVAECRG
jgi:pimeloyl-ACP methyl ester carboxylesterase